MTGVHMLITTGQGPAECGIGLAGFCAPFCASAHNSGLEVDWNAPAVEDPRSVLVSVHGAGAEGFAARFAGLWAWRCRSPLRPHHRRKLWCMEARVVPPAPVPVVLDPRAITWSTMRAGGPGGQHQNTTDSAVVASVICPRTGRVFSAQARDGRSQHRNKALALDRLAATMAQSMAQDSARRDAGLHALRATRPSGTPVAVLEGPLFERVIWPV